jgi:ParB/RepB/Spo0J family partition protein
MLARMDGEVGARALSALSESLHALRLCSEESGRDLERSLREHGQLTPLLCCRVSEAIEVVDGFKRLRAARQLGWAELRVEIREADRAEAKLLVFQSHRTEGLTDLEEAWVVRSLYREDGVSQPEIARRLGRDKSWACRRLQLAEGLAAGVEADVRLGMLCTSAVRELVRLPRGNQEACARAVIRRGLTTRQTARLVDTLLAADDQGRQDLLARIEAGGALELPAGRPPRRRVLGHGEWLSVEAAGLKRQAVRLHARVLQRSLSSLGEPAAELARNTLRDLIPCLSALQSTLQRACSVPAEATDARA